MGVNKWRNRHGVEKIVLSKIWPDGRRYRKVQPSMLIAKRLEERIDAAIALGTWRELREELCPSKPGIFNANLTVRQFAPIYFEEYCEIKNRRPDFKAGALKPIVAILGNVRIGDITNQSTHQY